MGVWPIKDDDLKCREFSLPWMWLNSSDLCPSPSSRSNMCPRITLSEQRSSPQAMKKRAKWNVDARCHSGCYQKKKLVILSGIYQEIFFNTEHSWRLFIKIIVVYKYHYHIVLFKKSTDYSWRMEKSSQKAACFLNRTKTISFDTLSARVLINVAFA